jgi:FkbM family methyltransferase
MSVLRKIAQSVRHSPALARADWLWKAVRGPYHWMLDPMGRGLKLDIGGHCTVRIPPEFAGLRWEEYEPTVFCFLRQWIGTHPNALVLDIGCSLGIFATAALFADPSVELVAFDPDLASLAVARRISRHAGGKRLRLVHGFLASKATHAVSLETAIATTAQSMANSILSGELRSIRYEGLNGPNARSIPSYRLDDLLAERVANERAILIKCDVEGAELEVLMGASDTLNRLRPDLMLSIHPHKDFGLVQYGHSKADVEAFLRAHDYVIDCIGIDHEEHWVCHSQSWRNVGPTSH